jgi:hypothetical protein
MGHMKMDFPHLADISPAERSRARYAALVACAANGQLRYSLVQTGRTVETPQFDRLDGLEARIGFFSKKRNRAKPPIYGAFLPSSGKERMVDEEAKIPINLADSVIGKPNFLGSRYPGHPETLRGMEN